MDRTAPYRDLPCNLPRERGFCQWLRLLCVIGELPARGGAPPPYASRGPRRRALLLPGAAGGDGWPAWVARVTHRLPFFASLLVLVVAGCDRNTAPELNRLPFEITQEFFAAAAKGDTVQAEKQLKRLQDLSPGLPFEVMARREINLRQRQTEVARLCQAGRLAEAEAVVRQAQQQLGPLPELRQLADTIAALKAVQSYCTLLPFASSDSAAKALARVKEYQPVLAGSSVFTTWLQAQEQTIAALRRRESLREFQQQVRVYDAALVAGKADPAVVLREITALASGSQIADTARQILVLSAESFEAWIGKGESWADPLQGVCLEIAAVREWTRLSPEARKRLLAAPLPQEPLSLSGIVLRARIAAAKGETIAAAAWVERLLRQTPVVRPLVEEGLTTLLLPKDQFQARAWRAPFPTFTDYLDRLEQLRQARP